MGVLSYPYKDWEWDYCLTPTWIGNGTTVLPLHGLGMGLLSYPYMDWEWDCTVLPLQGLGMGLLAVLSLHGLGMGSTTVYPYKIRNGTVLSYPYKVGNGTNICHTSTEMCNNLTLVGRLILAPDSSSAVSISSPSGSSIALITS